MSDQNTFKLQDLYSRNSYSSNRLLAHPVMLSARRDVDWKNHNTEIIEMLTLHFFFLPLQSD